MDKFDKVFIYADEPAFTDFPGGDYYGLSKLEYFASAAMQGKLAADKEESTAMHIAFCSVQLAKALIAELNKQT